MSRFDPFVLVVGWIVLAVLVVLVLVGWWIYLSLRSGSD